MSKTNYVKIHPCDFIFLLEKAELYIRYKKASVGSMKLWEDRIEEIKHKYVASGVGCYEYELRYLKNILLKIYQDHPEISFHDAKQLLYNEIGVHPYDLPVKTDIEHMTYTMIEDGEFIGEIDEKNQKVIYKQLSD
jgi:hypothetical protein